MINVNDINSISLLLSSTFFYGFDRQISEDVIEARIINNKYIGYLENGDSSFLIYTKQETIIESIFERNIDPEVILKTNPLSLWLGDIYTKLFFTFNKSFSFLFLYLPIKKAIELFSVYHEMDNSQLIDLFEKMVKAKTVISLLLEREQLTIGELSSLTGVNYNTIVSYTRDNEFIYNAKLDSIYKISQVLDVNINLFVRKINNLTNSSFYEFDKTNYRYRLYLAFYLASYIDKELRNSSFELNDEKLRDAKNVFDVLWTDSNNEDVLLLAQEYKKNKDVTNTILSIFDYKKTVSKESLDRFETLGYKKIFIISATNIYKITKDSKVSKEITSTINDSMIRQAKLKGNSDFAI
ncbi:MAG: hypothetical protein MJ248_03840 [Bacilli bacterium]|nr:hypothetical protein [Bacilli bacterium]